ncbi:MAG: ribokinase [Clostridia bacterium]|nr:ribokinase [Clostridia bacterium]
MSDIYVLGSMNMDMTVVSPRFPKLGETINGHSFSTAHGGKGANQAVAAARLGANVSMCACIGKDANGKELKESLEYEGINTDYVFESDSSTGAAVITLVDGDNTIIVAKGANADVTCRQAELFLDKAKPGDILLVQLETDFKTVEYALKLAKSKKMITVLNPAPADPECSALCEFCDYIIPNETELKTITGNDDIEFSIRKIKDNYSCIPVATLGSQGCAFYRNESVVFLPCEKVKAVDTTGAGDTFCGAFCVALSNDEPIENCLKFALKCATLSVTKTGAQPSIPFLKDIK